MKKFLGVKQIEAEPLSLGDYNKFRGWQMPENEDPLREGYKVVYSDGYVSWSPKEIFEESYRETTELTFGLAVEALKKCKKVTRKGWNGSGMFLYLVPGSTVKVSREPLISILGEGTEINIRPHIDLKTADGSIATWSPSGSDALAEDWIILE